LAELPGRVEGVTAYNSTEYADACGAFSDAVADETMRVVPVRGLFPVLESAVLGGVRRFHGDLWRWGRIDDDADITGLVAASLAYHRAVVANAGSDPIVMFA
jgi:hypothetical protein